jgi:hypothetical protein
MREEHLKKARRGEPRIQGEQLVQQSRPASPMPKDEQRGMDLSRVDSLSKSMLLNAAEDGIRRGASRKKNRAWNVRSINAETGAAQ